MTKAEKLHRMRVASLGCIVCLNNGHPDTPATLHHIRSGQGMSQRAPELEIIPLCPFHHQQGGLGNAIHAGQATWEKTHGKERVLLEQVRQLLNIA